MKKTLCSVAVFAVILIAILAIAAENPGPGPGCCPCPFSPGGAKPDFATMKPKIQEMITDKIARDQKELNCVKAAQNMEALEACRPPHPGMRKPK